MSLPLHAPAMRTDALTTLLVDDERPARHRLSLLLEEHLDVHVVGECGTVGEATRMVRDLHPALVFLDVSMPGGNGFRLFDTLPARSRPIVVFVTAHAEHAARAFEVDAVDYLLKPFDEDRLAHAMDKVRRARAVDATTALRDEIRALGAILPIVSRPPALGAAVRESPVEGTRPTRFAVTVGRRIVFIAVADIDWVQADRNYVWLHTSTGGRHLHRCGIGAMEAQLEPLQFIRTHRSAIVRIDRVRELRTLESGDAIAVLQDGTQIPVSARRRAIVEHAP